MAQTRPSPTLSREFTRLGRFLAPYGEAYEVSGTAWLLAVCRSLLEPTLVYC